MIDSVLRVSSPEGVTFDLYPAGPFPRIAALLLDTFIEGCIFTVLVGFAYGLKLRGLWIIYIAGFCVSWLYMIVFELASGGQSPGKRMLGLKVVMRDGSPVTSGASILRNLLRLADLVAALGIIIPLFNSGFRRLGDLAAGTLVIYKKETTTEFGAIPGFESARPRPPERILDAEAALAALEFSRRRVELSLGRQNELAGLALPVYLLDPENDQNPVDSMVSVAAWYSGLRPGQTTERQ